MRARAWLPTQYGKHQGAPVVRGRDRYRARPDRRDHGHAEKGGLLDGLGISPHAGNRRVYNVKIGFDGYNQTKTKIPAGATEPNDRTRGGKRDIAAKKSTRL